MTAGGQPVKSAPVPENNAKSRYAFLFPLRPGETRFSVVYTLPFTGSANIDPKSVYPLEHFVAIDAPDPLQKYRWQILGGFALVLVAGGVYVASRQQAASRTARAQGKALPSLEEDEDYGSAELPAAREIRTSEARLSEARPQPTAPRRSSSILLEALKEEIFELEVEHKQGRISQQEYESAKSALDQTLQRALKREAQKASRTAT
jgi:hypothetical protein